MVGPARVLGLALGWSALFLACGCGTTSGAGTASGASGCAVSGAALDGNWNIVGTGALNSTGYPSLAFSLVAHGEQLYASGDMAVSCGPTGGGGGSITLTGQIAADGSFQLTQLAPTGVTLDGSFINVVVNGTVPAPGATSWSGSYSMQNAAGTTGCVTNNSGTFTAAPFTPFTGTYAGNLSGTQSSIPFSFTVTQGAPAEFTTGLGMQYYLSVTGTVSVTGIPCFTQGSAIGSALNQVAGNNVQLDYQMTDGSELIFSARLASVQSAMLDVVSVAILGGQCNGFYSGTLARQ
jgi:hypothetical protein